MSFLLDDHALKIYVDNVMATPADVDFLKKCKAEMAKVKRMIVDVVKDHVVLHIANRGTAKEMWDALSTLYQDLPSSRRCT